MYRERQKENTVRIRHPPKTKENKKQDERNQKAHCWQLLYCSSVTKLWLVPIR